jgi:hypothetical protein
MMEAEGRLPDTIIAAIGGGSNAMGLFYPFLDDKSVRIWSVDTASKVASLKGHTLYTTCEPCPMCMAMALWAGIDRVVFGSTISDASRHCAQIYVPAKTLQRKSDMDCEVVGPVLRKECVALFEDPRMLSAMALWKKSRGGTPAKPVRRASGS